MGSAGILAHSLSYSKHGFSPRMQWGGGLGCKQKLTQLELGMGWGGMCVCVGGGG